MEITISMREYLAEIYRLQYYEYGFEVRSVYVAKRLDVSAAAVARMLNRLIEKKLVKQDHYGKISLTKSGRLEASKGLRWHRILELFASEQLGFDFDDLYSKARLMIKGVDEEIVERMAAVLGDPTECPHGEYIPPAGEIMPEHQDVCISFVDVENGSEGVVSRIRTRDKAKRDYFYQIGAVPGTKYKVINRAPYLGPQRVLFGDKEWLIVPSIGFELWVKPCDGTYSKMSKKDIQSAYWNASADFVQVRDE